MFLYTFVDFRAEDIHKKRLTCKKKKTHYNESDRIVSCRGEWSVIQLIALNRPFPTYKATENHLNAAI